MHIAIETPGTTKLNILTEKTIFYKNMTNGLKVSVGVLVLLFFSDKLCFVSSDTVTVEISIKEV